MILGVLVVAGGLAWLLDDAGLAVPWRLLPAVGLIGIGLALLLVPRARATLIVLGVVLLLTSVLAASTIAVPSGSVGDRTLRPAAAEWPVESRLGAGNLIVDLADVALPGGGTMRLDVGTGQILLVLPADEPVEVQAGVGIGDITVDGRSVDSGLSAQWSTDSSAAIIIDARVGVGSIEVRHE